MKEGINFLVKDIKVAFSRDYIKIISVFLFFFFCFTYIYLTNEKLASLDDQVFSIRYAELIKENGVNVFTNFPWLHFSKITQGQQLFSYNFIFYITLTLFTFCEPLFLGIKFYGVVFASLSFSVLFLFFLKTKIRHPFFWVFSLFAIVNSAYIWKLLMARSFTIAPALLLLEIYFLHRKRYWSVFFVSVIYFFWHSATFFFPLFVAILFFAFNNLYTKRSNWKAVYGSLVGILFSFIFIAATFSLDGFVSFIVANFGIFKDIIFGKEVQISQGVELNPINALDFVRTHGLIVVLFIISAAFQIYNYIDSKRKHPDSFGESESEIATMKSTLFFLSLFFFLGSFLSGRNVDFFVYFSMAFIALSFNYFIQNVEWKSVVVKKSFFFGIMIVAIYFATSSILDIKTGISNVGPLDVIQGSAEWLKNNTEKGDIIFTPTMNFFPYLFYYNSDNYYMVGAEPKLFYDYDSKMYWAWWNISNNGFLCFQEKCLELEAKRNLMFRNENKKEEWAKQQGVGIAEYIKKYFNSKYILTSNDFSALNLVLENSDRFERVFEDKIYKKYSIYRIR
jgi:hypothetical protein